MAEYQEGKARKLAETRTRQQYDELQGCTFRPAINGRRTASRGRVLVRGVASHLEKQKAAQRKAEAAELRAAEVFILTPKTPAAKYTIARPFDLCLEKRVRRCSRCCTWFAVDSCLNERESGASNHEHPGHCKILSLH